jgi:hypothetical protein
LTRFFDDVHLARQPKPDNLPDVLLVRKRLRGNRWIMLVASPRIGEKPILGVSGAFAALLFL